jgi:hypothetical protein
MESDATPSPASFPTGGSLMAARTYSFDDWQRDFTFLTRYVYPSESGYFPPDYLAEIREHFQKHYPEEAPFVFGRLSAMFPFLVKNIDAFTVGGIAMRTFEAAEISPALWFALWMFFIAEEEKFDPDPDPRAVLELAETVDAAGLFGPRT